jgi:ubiquinone biosynthesis protein
VRVVVGLILLVLFVVVVGKLCGRLLGIRLGRWRGVLVGLVGWAAGVTAAVLVFGEDTPRGFVFEREGSADWFAASAIAVFFGVLAAMPFAIALDLLTRGARDAPPRRRHRVRAVVHPARSVRTAVAPYARLNEVIGNARRQNLLHLRYASRAAFESPDLSRRVRTVLEDSGGMLVKFGQIASTRTDVLPDALTTELALLRQDVRTVPPEGIREVLEAELDEPVEAAFATFDWEPLAAASIGQTHRATLADGTRVVVKVQRPGIAEVVGRDAAVMRLAARQIERRSEAARTVHLTDLAEELAAGVAEELNYLHEATGGTRLRERRAGDEGISFPRVYTTLSTARVLVMEEVVGRPVSDQEAIGASPVPRDELARRLLASFLGQVLEDGVFHGDPHPGNVFVDADGRLWMLDFGSIGRLDARSSAGLRGIALGIAAADPALLARAARDLAGDAGLADLRALEADMANELTQLQQGGLDPQLISQVLAVMERHGMRPPPSMALLARALLTLEGTLSFIAPAFSVRGASSQIVRVEHADEIRTPEEILQHEALRALPSLRTLPEHAEAISEQLRSGRLTVRAERYAGGDRAVVESLVDRLVLAIVGTGGTAASGLILLAASGADEGTEANVLWILGLSGLTAGSVLMMRAAARALRRQAGRID